MESAIIISNKEKPRCLLDAIGPYSRGSRSCATNSKPSSPKRHLLRTDMAAGTEFVPALFIVGRVNVTVKAPRCNEGLLVFCN